MNQPAPFYLFSSAGHFPNGNPWQVPWKGMSRPTKCFRTHDFRLRIVNYSCRNATMGSTSEARRAGTHAATNATRSNRKVNPTNTDALIVTNPEQHRLSCLRHDERQNAAKRESQRRQAQGAPSYQHEDIAPGGEPHPDTRALYRQLATATPEPARVR